MSFSSKILFVLLIGSCLLLVSSPADSIGFGLGLFGVLSSFLVSLYEGHYWKRAFGNEMLQLEKRFTAGKRLFSHIAHDLSNPVHVLQFCTEELAHQERPNCYIEKLNKNVRKLTEFIDSLRSGLEFDSNRHPTLEELHRGALNLLKISLWREVKYGKFSVDERLKDYVILIPTMEFLFVLHQLYHNCIASAEENAAISLKGYLVDDLIIDIMSNQKNAMPASVTDEVSRVLNRYNSSVEVCFSDEHLRFRLFIAKKYINRNQVLQKTDFQEGDLGL